MTDEDYTQNRATLHLHGGFTPWISDGTPHQWTTPAGEIDHLPQGRQRLATSRTWPTPGQTRAGRADLLLHQPAERPADVLPRPRLRHHPPERLCRRGRGYLITDQVEQDLINGTNVTGVNPGLSSVLPDIGIPLIIQDKTFVDADHDRRPGPDLWHWGPDATRAHAVRPATSGARTSTCPPRTPATHRRHERLRPLALRPLVLAADDRHRRTGPIANPYYDPVNAPWEPPLMPDTPNPSMAMEAFMDTPLVNGTAYPVPGGASRRPTASAS